MFVQIIKGKVTDEQALEKLLDRWESELKADAQGFLGSTGGVTENGEMISLVRFESEDQARRNSERPEQDAWAKEMAEVVENATFIDCPDVDVMLGGGSDDAGFVQVMEGTADKDRLKEVGPQMEPEMREMRPDILGGVVAWHPDGKGFTQAMYFESEKSARENEAGSEGPPEELTELMKIESYYDIRKPRMF
jgi:hypothetical protein